MLFRSPAVETIETAADEEPLENPFPVDNETIPLTAEDVFLTGAAVH